MLSLLTGKTHDPIRPAPDSEADADWTAEDYRAAMRRLLHAASKTYANPSPGQDAERDRMLTAAGVLAEAAKSVPGAVRRLPSGGDAQGATGQITIPT
jgi:hypothetical protein